MNPLALRPLDDFLWGVLEGEMELDKAASAGFVGSVIRL